MLEVAKMLLVCMVFLHSNEEAYTSVQAASDSKKDITWYLISANVLTNTSASMLSDKVVAISDTGVGTTLLKNMLPFCNKNKKLLLFRKTNADKGKLLCEPSFVITTNSNKWICTNLGWLSVEKNAQGFIIKPIFCTITCISL